MPPSKIGQKGKGIARTRGTDRSSKPSLLPPIRSLHPVQAELTDLPLLWSFSRRVVGMADIYRCVWRGGGETGGEYGDEIGFFTDLPLRAELLLIHRPFFCRAVAAGKPGGGEKNKEEKWEIEKALHTLPVGASLCVASPPGGKLFARISNNSTVRAANEGSGKGGTRKKSKARTMP